jgi:MFS family permease
LAGALGAARLGARFGVGRITIASHAGMALAVGVLALSSSDWAGWVVFGLGELILGLSMGASNANEMGYRQSVTPDHLQGRMNATMRSINRAMIVIGAPLGGLLADAIGFRVVLWLAVAGFLTIATGLSTTPYRDARIEEDPTQLAAER